MRCGEQVQRVSREGGRVVLDLVTPAGRRTVTVDHVIANASHFLQEDAGSQIGRLIADWLS